MEMIFFREYTEIIVTSRDGLLVSKEVLKTWLVKLLIPQFSLYNFTFTFTSFRGLKNSLDEIRESSLFTIETSKKGDNKTLFYIHIPILRTVLRTFP